MSVPLVVLWRLGNSGRDFPATKHFQELVSLSFFRFSLFFSSIFESLSSVIIATDDVGSRTLRREIPLKGGRSQSLFVVGEFRRRVSHFMNMVTFNGRADFFLLSKHLGTVQKRLKTISTVSQEKEDCLLFERNAFGGLHDHLWFLP
jgi:hypothetical protein